MNAHPAHPDWGKRTSESARLFGHSFLTFPDRTNRRITMEAKKTVGHFLKEVERKSQEHPVAEEREELERKRKEDPEFRKLAVQEEQKALEAQKFVGS